MGYLSACGPVVESVVSSLEFLDRRVVTDASRPRWQRRVAELLHGYAPFTWQTPKGESEENRLTRASILGTLGEVGGNTRVIAGARTLTERYMRDPAAVDPTLAGAALKSFMTKCEKDSKATCDASATEKKLSGAARNSFTKKCVRDATGA